VISPEIDFPSQLHFQTLESVSEHDAEGLPFFSLKTLIELKLASGMTAAHRMQDMADVMNLIRINKLATRYSQSLNPYVATKFEELWKAAQINEDY
jgi:hypothetical protein